LKRESTLHLPKGAISWKVNTMPKIYRKRYLRQKKGRDSNLTIIILIVILIVGGVLIFLAVSSRPSVNTRGLQLPAYAYRSPEITQAFVAAASIPQIFEYIPCYCGCGYMTHLPYFHKHLRDCFISDQGEYQTHPLGCATCVEEALQVWAMYQRNIPLRDIRKAVDDRFSRVEGALPTPMTPQPP